MTGKEVFVESYVRSDGTEVKAHYRNAPHAGSTGLSGSSELVAEARNLFDENEKHPRIDERNYPSPVSYFGEEGTIPEETQEQMPFQIFEENKEQGQEQNSEQSFPIEGNSIDERFQEGFSDSQQDESITQPKFFKLGISYDTPQTDNVEPVKSKTTDDSVLDKYINSKIISEIIPKIIPEIKIDIDDLKKNLKQIRIELPNTKRYQTQRIKIEKAINKMEVNYQKALQIESELLDKMVQTTSRSLYSKLYEKYLKQRKVNNQNVQTIKKIKYSFQNEKYDAIVEALNDYESNSLEVIAKNFLNRPLQSNITSSNFIKFLKSYPSKSSFHHNSKKDTNKNDNKKSYIAKKIVDFGMFLKMLETKNQINDAKEMWKASSYDFLQSSKYIQKNGSVVYSIYDLPSKELQDIVKLKINKSKMSDSIGIIYHSNSEMSKQIAKDDAIKDKILQHKYELLNNKVVKGESVYFGDNKNLKLSLGHVDIPYMFLDKDGDIKALILDVYDFEPDDQDWKVRIAAKAQTGGNIRNYYSLHVVRIPKYMWQDKILIINSKQYQ